MWWFRRVCVRRSHRDFCERIGAPDMLRHFILKPKAVNRLAIIGILPLMVL